MVCEPILITGPHLVTCVARCRRATGALIGSGGSALGCGCGLRWALSLSHQTAVQTSAAPCAGGRAGSRDAGLAAASRSSSLLRPPRILLHAASRRPAVPPPRRATAPPRHRVTAPPPRRATTLRTACLGCRGSATASVGAATASVGAARPCSRALLVRTAGGGCRGGIREE